MSNIHIDIEAGTKFDDTIPYEKNYFKLIEPRSGMCLADNVEGLDKASELLAKFQKTFQAWDIVMEDLKSSYNEKTTAGVIAAAIMATGHKTYEATAVRNLKSGMERYAEICEMWKRIDERNRPAIEYIKKGKDTYIPFI